MCGRFVSASPPDELARYFAVDKLGESVLEPKYNVAPTDSVYGIFEKDHERRLETFHWGLVPYWAKDVGVGNRMINARVETLTSSNAFKGAFERRRCIVPGDGFYEWRKVEGRRKKQPVYIRRRDGEPLAMAGLWEAWRGPEHDEDPLFSCTIVTGEPNELVEPIHDRMPVILPVETWEEWLDRDNRDVDALQRLLRPIPADRLEAWNVGTDVNTVTNDGPELIEPVDPSAENGTEATELPLF
jgi:putative SOS response-associated peptidase YedK